VSRSDNQKNRKAVHTDGFAGTVAYYDRYRLAFPDRLIQRVTGLAGLKPGDKVLDLGCGTGMLAIAFARAGMAVTAMDPEAQMLEAARAAAQTAGVTVTWALGGSEDLKPGMGPFRLAVLGRSFHWMDRTAALAMLEQVVTEGIALFHDAHPPVAENGWFEVLCDIQKKYRARSTEKSSEKSSEKSQEKSKGGHRRYEPFLFASAFRQIDTLSVTIRQALSLEDILGRAFSMPASSPQRLGAAKDAFTSRLSAALRELSPDGKFIEVVELVAVLARRPE
jgi:ubiquinone/menaquinone biosynthesis C-methylase UbiE